MDAVLLGKLYELRGYPAQLISLHIAHDRFMSLSNSTFIALFLYIINMLKAFLKNEAFFKYFYSGVVSSTLLFIVISKSNQFLGLWNTVVQCLIHKGSPIIRILSRINWIPRIDTHFIISKSVIENLFTINNISSINIIIDMVGN